MRVRAARMPGFALDAPPSPRMHRQFNELRLTGSLPSPSAAGLRILELNLTSKLKKLRRGIARARTEQRNRERAQELQKDALRNLHRGSFQPGAAGADGSGEASGGFLSGIADQLGIGGNEGE